MAKQPRRWTPIKPGDKGLRVRVLQRRLDGREGVLLDDDLKPVKDKDGNFKGWKISCKADGDYGRETLRAVKSFEKMHGLRPDGVVGRNVCRKLDLKRAIRRRRRRRADRRADVIPRERWNAAPPRGTIGGVAEPVEVWFEHCTVYIELGPDATIDQECEVMRGLQQIAFSRGFLDISYSFVVFQSGRIYEGRGWDRSGAHTEGYNSTTYAIAWSIRCAGEKVEEKTFESAANLIARSIRQGSTKDNVWVRLHREVAAKSCPGDPVAERRGDVQRWARKRAAA